MVNEDNAKVNFVRINKYPILVKDGFFSENVNASSTGGSKQSTKILICFELTFASIIANIYIPKYSLV